MTTLNQILLDNIRKKYPKHGFADDFYKDEINIIKEWLQQKQEEVREKYIVKGFQRMRLQAINELLEELE